MIFYAFLPYIDVLNSQREHNVKVIHADLLETVNMVSPWNMATATADQYGQESVYVPPQEIILITDIKTMQNSTIEQY